MVTLLKGALTVLHRNNDRTLNRCCFCHKTIRFTVTALLSKVKGYIFVSISLFIRSHRLRSIHCHLKFHLALIGNKQMNLYQLSYLFTAFKLYFNFRIA